MEVSPSAESGREEEVGGCPSREGAAQMCGGSGLANSLWVRVRGEVAKHDTVVACVTDN